MKTNKRFITAGVLALALTSCSSMLKEITPTIPAAPYTEAEPAASGGEASFPTVEGGTFKSGYSWFTQIPSKENSVVGLVVVRDGAAPVVALMEAARELGADEVINIRLDTETVNGKENVLAASGVAVKYQAAFYTGGSEAGDKIVNSGAVRWSKYSAAPSKDFAGVQIVTVKGKNITTPAADLMDAAKALKAHDIINVRLDTEVLKKGSSLTKRIVGASALAITYTNATYWGLDSATGD
jgi:uncharacterized protein YbjQ (UPF0145 family)